MIENIFISQPMSGLTEKQIDKERKEEIKAIYDWLGNNKVDINIINSYINDHDRKSCEKAFSDILNWDVYWISHALQKLSMANVLWLGKGWEKSKGCQIEKQCAQAYGIPIIKSPRCREE